MAKTTMTYNGEGRVVAQRFDNRVKRSFDCHKRLTSADYSNSTDSQMDFSESYSYNAMSSLTSLFRYGICDIVDGQPSYGSLDKLWFSYRGNRIAYVTVGQSTDACGMVFDTRAGYGDGLEDSPNLYTYDANGNITSDDSRDINSIEYNVYNMPTRIEFNNGDSQTIEYDGNGNRLTVKYIKNLPDLSVGGDAHHVHVTTRRYIGDYVFEQVADGYGDADNDFVETGSLQYARFDGGYFDGDGMAHYLVPDFQGNTAMDIDEYGEVVQETHYYPYGEPWSQPTGQPWLFGGKERERRHHLGDSDFGARTYNAARATFARPDPLAEKYYPITPYAYCAADPVNHIDPSGMKWENASDSTYLKDELNALLNNCENIKAKKANMLKESKLSTKKRNKIQSEIDALNIRIDYIKRSIDYVKRLGDDTNIYKLRDTKEDLCYVKCENRKVVIVAFSLETKIHEIVHIVQFLNLGGLMFHDGSLLNPGCREIPGDTTMLSTRKTNMEIEAYSFQYAINRRTMPLPVSSISEIDSDYISRIGGRYQLYEFTE